MLIFCLSENKSEYTRIRFLLIQQKRNVYRTKRGERSLHCVLIDETYKSSAKPVAMHIEKLFDFIIIKS